MLRRVALGDGRFAGDIFAPDGVAPLARTRRLGARIKEILRVRDRGGEVLLRGAAHVRPGQVLRIARDVLRPIRAVGALGDIFEIREAQGRGAEAARGVGGGKVEQGFALLDGSVSHSARGLSSAQWGQLYAYLSGYQERGTGSLIIRAPTGGANEKAAKRAYDDVRHAMRRAGIGAKEVLLEPYFAKWDPAAPLRLSYLEYVAQGPDCPDWSENVCLLYTSPSPRD